MDDPSGNAITKKISLSELSSAIGFVSSGNVFPYIELTGFSSPTQWFGFGSGEWQVSDVNSVGEGEKSAPITAGLN
jgi:hypothetical protein